MADFVASDVVATMRKQRILRGSPGHIRFNSVKLVFGNGAITYATGGIPLSGAALGCPRGLEELLVSESAATYQWSLDPSTGKLVGIDVTTDAFLEIANGTAIAAQTIYGIAIGS